MVRVWELSAEALLAGPLALLPLAPVADVPLNEVPGVIVRAGTRLEHEADPETGERLLTAIGILLQLRYGTMTARGLMANPELREIEVFRLLAEDFKAEGLAEGMTVGRAEGLRLSVAHLGRKKFGPPSPEQEATLNAITDPARLEALVDRVLDATSWDELLKAD